MSRKEMLMTGERAEPIACPFCGGGAAHGLWADRRMAVRCLRCDAKGPSTDAVPEVCINIRPFIDQAIAAWNRRALLPPPENSLEGGEKASQGQAAALSDLQIKHMVDRFLAWKLPDTFRPDAGISFEPEHSKEYMASLGKPPMRHQPTGTNLFDAREAEAMVRHMVEGLPAELDATAQEMEPPTPLGALRFRMEQGGHTRADLAKLIGSSRATEILAGKRALSKAHIRLLADEWGIPARSLLGPAKSDASSPSEASAGTLPPDEPISYDELTKGEGE